MTVIAIVVAGTVGVSPDIAVTVASSGTGLLSSSSSRSLRSYRRSTTVRPAEHRHRWIRRGSMDVVSFALVRSLRRSCYDERLTSREGEVDHVR